MIIIQLSWLWFLLLVTGGVFSHGLDSECQKLDYNIDGVTTPNRSICVIVPVFDKYVHINITKRSPGTLYANAVFCDKQTEDFLFRIDGFLDIKFYVPYYASGRNCNPENVENVRMMFKSGSDSESVKFSVTMLREYETNRTQGGYIQLIHDYEYQKWIERQAMNLVNGISDENAGFHVFEIILYIVCGVLITYIVSVFGYEKYLDYKHENRLCDTELIQLQNIQCTPNPELARLDCHRSNTYQEWEPFPTFRKNSNVESGSHLP